MSNNVPFDKYKEFNRKAILANFEAIRKMAEASRLGAEQKAEIRDFPSEKKISREKD